MSLVFAKDERSGQAEAMGVDVYFLGRFGRFFQFTMCRVHRNIVCRSVIVICRDGGDVRVDVKGE